MTNQDRLTISEALDLASELIAFIRANTASEEQELSDANIQITTNSEAHAEAFIGLIGAAEAKIREASTIMEGKRT